MSGTADERLIVMLEARISEFEKRMGQAERRGTRTYQGLRRGSRTATRAMEMDMVRSTGRINQALASTSARIGTFGRGLVGGLAAGAAATAVAALTTNLRGTVTAIAAVGDEARRAGLGVEEFQQWAYVANQNRIAVDALVDGFKELNLRADEWIVTGGGAAAEAFARLGFSAEDLRRRLEDPSELMLEIFRRMESLDRAAQIRVFDEILGGTGGERFVELLAQGEHGLRRTLARAREVGAVMREDMIDSAADLDRRFSELSSSVGNFFKWVTIEVADFVLQVANLRGEIEGIQGLRDQRQGASLLGAPAAEALAGDTAAAREHADTVAEILTLYERLQAEAEGLAPAIQRLGDELNDADHAEAAAAVSALALGIERLGQQLDAGEITAAEYEGQMRDLVTQAETALGSIEDLDTPTFTRVMARLGSLGEMLGRLTTQAATLRNTLPGRPESVRQSESFWDTEESRFGLNRLAPVSSPRPQPAPLEGDPAYGGTGTGGGGGGGGGAHGYAAAAAEIRARTEALTIEAAALVAAAAAGEDYGDAIEYARQRAELMLAAQQEGREITPALQAEIDSLARAYVQAGNAAERSAEQLREVEAQARRGAERIVDLFGQMAQGGDVAQRAVLDLIAELLRMRAIEGLSGLAKSGGGGFLDSFVRFLGFDQGGYTGDGGTHEPKGIVHGGEYVFSKRAVQALGVARLERMHRAAKGYASGGYVGGSGAAGAAQDVNVRVSIDENGNLQAFVDKRADQRASRAIQAARPGLVRESVTATRASAREFPL
ncbi:phage tail tape measure protein [Pararhodobacter aggregans]